MPETETTTTEQQQEAQSGEQSNDEQLGEAGVKALAAERKARNDAEKALKDALSSVDNLSARVKQFEDAGKSEDQKKVDRIAELENLLADKDTQLSRKNQDILRSTVAQEKGVPVGMVTGSTREEMEASADAALDWRGADGKQRTPIGALRSGASKQSNDDPKQRAADALKSMWRNK